MAFPPNFTNNWDITVPADTQLANLLGQDLRNVRLDVMQRLSLLSGTLANRPTPEIINATWGGAGFGLLYFATDTSQVFQWNGAAWVDVTVAVIGTRTTVLFKDSTLHNHTGTVTEDTIYTVPINPNSLGTTGVIKCTFAFSYVVFSGIPSIKVRFGGTLLATYSPNTPAATIATFLLGNRGVTNSQEFNVVFESSGLATQVFTSTAAVDTTLAQNLTITMQNSAITDSQNFNQAVVEQL